MKYQTLCLTSDVSGHNKNKFTESLLLVIFLITNAYFYEIRTAPPPIVDFMFLNESKFL